MLGASLKMGKKARVRSGTLPFLAPSPPGRLREKGEPIQPKPPTKQLAVNLFLLLLSVYVLTSSGNSTDVTDDGVLRLAVTQSILEHGSVALPDDLGKLVGMRGIDGKYYTNHGLGQSLLNIPFYMAGQWIGRPKFIVSLLGPLTCSLACVLLFHLALRVGYSLNTSLSVSLLTGLCTQLWPESKSPFNHNTETLFSLACVYLVWTGTQTNSIQLRRLVAAGAGLGFAVLTRASALFWLLPLFLFFVRTSLTQTGLQAQVRNLFKSGFAFLLGLSPFLFLVLWYNAVRFGSMLESGYSEWARQRGFDNFSNPLWLGLIGELISPGKGVLLYCPILLLACLGARSFLTKRNKIGILVACATLFYLLFFAKYKAWHGDNAWGPRYLTFLMPFWMLAAGEWLRLRQGMAGWRVTSGRLIIVVSFLIQFAAVLVDKNLHYNRLFEAGVIRHANTYAYPPELYFRPKYSPLLDRVREIPEVLKFTYHQVVVKHNAPASEAEELFSVDFWWINRLSRGVNPFGCFLLIVPFIVEIAVCARRIQGILKQSNATAALSEGSSDGDSAAVENQPAAASPISGSSIKNGEI